MSILWFGVIYWIGILWLGLASCISIMWLGLVYWISLLTSPHPSRTSETRKSWMNTQLTVYREYGSAAGHPYSADSFMEPASSYDPYSQMFVLSVLRLWKRQRGVERETYFCVWAWVSDWVSVFVVDVTHIACVSSAATCAKKHLSSDLHYENSVQLTFLWRLSWEFCQQSFCNHFVCHALRNLIMIPSKQSLSRYTGSQRPNPCLGLRSSGRSSRRNFDDRAPQALKVAFLIHYSEYITMHVLWLNVLSASTAPTHSTLCT